MLGVVEEGMTLPMTLGLVVSLSTASLTVDFERRGVGSHFVVVVSDWFASVGCVKTFLMR